ncbi:MAG: hypothetical protein ACREN5_15710, partial [Gemmatimonadales bacterium]
MGGPNAVAGLVDFDVDQDSTTGLPTDVDAFRPDPGGSTGMGMEFVLDMLPADFGADSRVPVLDLRGSTIVVTGTVKPTFSGNRLTVRVPRTLLGGDDAFMNVAVVMGNDTGPTDIAPNAGHLTLGGASPAPPFRPAGPARKPATAASHGGA